MKRSILLSLSLLYLLAACSNAPVQKTSIPATETHIPTETPANASTPTLQPSLTPAPITVINVENAAQLVALHTFEDQTSRNLAIFSEDGRSIMAMDKYINEEKPSLFFWDINNFSALPSVEIEADNLWIPIAFDPAGKFFAANANDSKKTGYEVSIFQLSDGKQIFEIQGLEWDVADIDWSANGSLIALGLLDGQVQVYRTDDFSRVFQIKIQNNRTNTISFSPNSQLLAAAGHDEVVRIWNTSDWSEKYILEDSEAPIQDIDFSPDGKFLAIAEAGGSHVWDMETGKRLLQFNPKYKEFAVAYSPDGMLLAAAGNDRHVRIWRTDTFELVADLTGHKTRVIRLDFSPNGQFLASNTEFGGADSPPSVILWGLP